MEAGQGDEDNNNGDRDGDGDKTTGRGGCNDGPTGAGYFFFLLLSSRFCILVV